MTCNFELVAQTFLSVLCSRRDRMNEPTLNIRRRNLPHWTLEGSTYFITFCTSRSTLSDEERQLVIEHLRSGNDKFYRLAAAVVMPDHVHLLLRPLPGFDLSRIMKGIKGVSAHKINQRRKTSGIIWQDESWDRVVRDAGEFEEKLQYMADNPLKAGVVKEIEQYPGWFCNPEFM
jgi:REP element-mobilizing transposase RayT